MIKIYIYINKVSTVAVMFKEQNEFPHYLLVMYHFWWGQGGVLLFFTFFLIICALTNDHKIMK